MCIILVYYHTYHSPYDTYQIYFCERDVAIEEAYSRGDKQLLLSHTFTHDLSHTYTHTDTHFAIRPHTNRFCLQERPSNLENLL